jgi:capping protein alpha
LISKEESAHQTSLNDAFQDMSEKAFKTLRRALPLTRQKLDWDKVRLNLVLDRKLAQRGQVTGYKLGAELTASKGIFQSVPEP